MTVNYEIILLLRIKNTFSVLHDTSNDESNSSANTKYLQFEKSCRNAAAEIIPLKPKLKQRSPWETINISQKRASLHEAAKLKDQNPTPELIKNFKLIQSSFVKLYENEQNDYIENKIEEIQNAATNKKSALAWKTVNK